MRKDHDMAGLNALKRDLWQLESHLLRGRLSLAVGVRDFVRERITVPRAEEEIKRLLDRRDETFLELVRTRIYARPGSPYHKLFTLAGCEFSDLQTHIRRHGLEGTLEQLAREGVYLTADEFKGKKEVVRSGLAFTISSREFQRSDSSPGFATQSSGTRNRPVPSNIFLDWLAIRTFATAVFFSAHDLFSHTHAIYDAILPAGGGVNNLLMYARLGVTTDRWFARTMPVDTFLRGAYHYLTTQLIVLAGTWFGPGLPRPEFLDIRDVNRIVRWVADRRRAGKLCCITTPASNAARIARVAEEMGMSLEGTKFIATGEPLTESKREAIERVGASATPRYAYGGGFNIGFGCANPGHTDEIHVNQHMQALIPHPRPLTNDGPSIHPLLCTSVHPLAPRLLLNVENGDYATFARRDCGCALERVGLTLHLHTIRSFEKFATEGMNYFYADLFQLLEKTLPSQFGGGPGDYQLVEEEDADGQSRLSLMVHPGVNHLNEERLLSRLLESLMEGPWGNQLMARIWRDAGTLRVRREVPYASPRGKILPLHIPH